MTAGRWADFAEQVASARDLIERSDALELEVQKTLELAAELAQSAGRSHEADQVLALARRVANARRKRNPSAP